MNPIRKLQPRKPTYQQVEKAAEEIVAPNKKNILSPSKDKINSKVRSKMDNSSSYYDKNIKRRDLARVISWVCFAISLSGALFGIGTFIEPNNPTSWILVIVSGIIVGAVEFGFRYYSDKHYDARFLFKKQLTKYFSKFLICSLITISISSGGIYKHNMKNHAPDPTLVAAKESLAETKKMLASADAAHKIFEDKNTIKSGDWEGEVKDNMKKAVGASKAKVDNIRAEVLRLTKLTSGKKTLDANYQNQVFYDSLLFALMLAIFQGIYIFCMRYMSKFDARVFKEENPKEYLELLASNNDQEINFT